MLPTRQGLNTQPPDHQSDTHPTEPPRPAVRHFLTFSSIRIADKAWYWDAYEISLNIKADG